MREVFLSIIITTYKRNEWLEECLSSIHESILAYKSQGGIKAIEVIVSDDDPQQNSFPIAKWVSKFEADSVSFIYNINVSNQGDYFNRNEGISCSSGKWVKFIDDDDLVYEWTISFMIDKLEKSAEANTVIFYLRDNFRHEKFPVVLKQEEIFNFHYKKYGLFHCSLVSAAFLRADMVQKGGFKFKRFYGDFQIFHEMASEGTFYIYPIELGWYRMHENQESNNNRGMVRIRFNYLMFSFHYFISNDSLKEKYLDVLLKDTFAYIRHATKRFDWPLLQRAVKLNGIIRSYRANPSAFNFENWKQFYGAEMMFRNNSFGKLRSSSL